MATIIKAPANNSTLNDANLTEIILEDTTTFKYYTANIYIDNILYDTVILPKFSNNRMILLFENLLLKYIQIPELQNYTIQKHDLWKNLRIDFLKHSDVGANITTNSVSYKLLYCTVPTYEKFEYRILDWVGVDADCFVISENGMIKLPFYTRNITDMVFIELRDENDLVFRTLSSANVGNGNFLVLTVYLDIPTHISNFKLLVRIGSNTIEKYFRVFRNQLYTPKKVTFYNRFGLPIMVELFGKASIKDEFTYFKYQNSLAEIKMAEVTTESNFSIDTGYLLNSEKGIIPQICSSLDVRLFYNEQHYPCVVNTKSIQVFADNEYITSSQLQFEMNKYPKIKNT